MEDHPHDRNPKDLEYDCRLCAQQTEGKYPTKHDSNSSFAVTWQTLASGYWRTAATGGHLPWISSKQASKNASLVSLSNQDTRCWNSLPEGCKAANPFEDWKLQLLFTGRRVDAKIMRHLKKMSIRMHWSIRLNFMNLFAHVCTVVCDTSFFCKVDSLKSDANGMGPQVEQFFRTSHSRKPGVPTRHAWGVWILPALYETIYN